MKNIDTSDTNNSVLSTIRSWYTSLFNAEIKVADYILNNVNDVIKCNVSELAEKSNVSDATVVRFCQKIGYKGYYQMKIYLAKEIGVTSKSIDQSGEEPDNIKGQINKIIGTNIKNLQETAKFINCDVIEKCAALINECEYLYIFAAGNTLTVAQDAAFRLSRIGKIRTISYLIPELQLSSANNITSKDLVLGISHSGSSNLVISALNIAKERGAKIVTITNYAKTPVSKIADYPIITACDDNGYYDDFAMSRIVEIVVIDLLLYFITQLRKNKANESDKEIEEVLSEFRY